MRSRLLIVAALASLGAACAASAQEPVPATPETAAPSPDAAPADPDAGLRAGERIARRYGAKRKQIRFVISAAGIPEGVDAERFAALAETQGSRWGHRPDGITLDAVSLRNRRTEVGFSRRVPAGSLGITSFRHLARYRRTVRCRVSPSGARSGCVTIGVRRLGVVVTDRDIMLRRSARWEAGPALPDDEEYDLQSVLLHEFGHLAGNEGHARGCAVTPMTPALAPGDWWRSTLDHRLVCRAGARAASRTSRALRFGRRTIVERRYETVVISDRRAGP